MREEIVSTIQKMIEPLVSMPVVIGSVPPLEGYAVSVVGGSPLGTFFDLNSAQRLPILFNGKSADMKKLAAEMDAVHTALTTSKVGGSPLGTFFDLNSAQRLPILFNGKSADMKKLAAEMDAVHTALTTSKCLPYAQDWQIYAINTTSAPNLIGREENRNWIYGSGFVIKYYAKGEKNG